MTSEEQYDVIILGGGLAGLTLARQLKCSCPEASILIVEKRKHPVPEAAHKVGESTVELGAHYLRDVLGLGEHLKADQLPKAGLRFFHSLGENRDIARRVEIGLSSFLPIRSYQLDRGRLENWLAGENLRNGIAFLDACKVEQISLGPSLHSVTLSREERAFGITTRWVVDASGRACLLKRRLDLVKKVGHNVNAAWFRINDCIDVDDWSNDSRWRARVPAGFRRLSTNHLLGRGYWVWLIPLASGSTSIGIVADAVLHPFDEFNRFDRALEWLKKHEPQCAKSVDERRDRLQDFNVLKHYAHSCERVFSPDRWCITGDGGVFLDPFYSPGTDFIALSNTFITNLIIGDLSGEPIKERAEAYNRLYLTMFEAFLRIFEGQYPLMGNTQVMTAKVVWDFATYWGVLALLYFNDKFCDLDFMSSVGYDLQRFNQLSARMQSFFREWDELDQRASRDGFVDYGKINFLYALHSRLIASLKEEELRNRIAENVDLMETIAATMFCKAAELLSVFLWKEAINPYAISLRPERWQVEGLFLKGERNTTSGDVVAELNKIWLQVMEL